MSPGSRLSVVVAEFVVALAAEACCSAGSLSTGLPGVS